MRSIWIEDVVGGPSLDFDRLRADGFARLYFRATDPGVTPGYLDAVRSQKTTAGIPFGVGVFRDPYWTAGISPTDYAALASADMSRLGGDSAQLAYEHDIEYGGNLHDPAWMHAFFFGTVVSGQPVRGWRGSGGKPNRLGYRPNRDSSWTLEPFQGGWVAAIPDLAAANFALKPQCYDGAMNPYDSAAVVDDLARFGIKRVVPMHDAARLLPRWDGTAFTYDRLPAGLLARLRKLARRVSRPARV